MRMRRRRFTTRRTRRRTAWLSAASTDACPVELQVDDCDDLQPFTVDVFQILQNPVDTLPGVVGNLEDVTLIRLVGEIILYGFHDNPTASTISVSSLEVSMGVYLSDTDPSGQVMIKDPTTPGDAESKDWMWRDTAQLAAAVRSTSSAAEGTPKAQLVTAERHIDIKVKRKVRKEEGVYIAFKAVRGVLLGQSPINVNCWLTANLRALVMLP